MDSDNRNPPVLESTPEVAPTKRAYVTPVLVRYGDVRALTMNGTPSFNEEGAPGHSGCGKSLGIACPSDRSLKQGLVEVGQHPWGFGLYLFEFKPQFRDAHGHGLQFGVMADEVEQVAPHAVHVHPAGYKVVDYGALGISRELPLQ